MRVPHDDGLAKQEIERLHRYDVFRTHVNKNPVGLRQQPYQMPIEEQVANNRSDSFLFSQRKYANVRWEFDPSDAVRNDVQRIDVRCYLEKPIMKEAQDVVIEVNLLSNDEE